MIPAATVEKIKDTLRIEEVIGDYVNLKRSGSNYLGLCPLHGEKNPSFNVNPSRGIFKCFGCGEGGDAIAFLMKLDGLSYLEALKVIARKYNITVEEEQLSEEHHADLQRREALSLVNQFARDFYVRQLLESQEGQSIGLSYFKKRGYSEKSIRHFELGYAPVSGDALRKAALEAGFREDLLRDLGLVTQDGQRDFMRDRVIFPIHSASGKVLAFAGRILKSDTKAPKYLNSPETELYVKNKTLYGLHLARTAIRREDQCIIVEGYADVIALHQAGVENVVASSGTSLTEGHISLIKRLTERVIFLYDGDKAGIKAALRGLDLVLAEGMQVQLLSLPDQHDPDSYVQAHGGEALREYIATEGKDFIQYKSQLVDEESKGDPIVRAQLIQSVLRSVALVPNPILRNEYLRSTSSFFQIDESTLIPQLNTYLQEFQNERKRKASVEARNQSAELAAEAAQQVSLEPEIPVQDLEKLSAPKAKRQDRLLPSDDTFRDRDIAGILIAFGDKRFSPESEYTVAETILANIIEVMDFFDDPLCAEIMTEALEMVQNEQVIPTSHWVSHKNPEVQKFAASVLATPYELSPGWWNRLEITLNTQKPPDENWMAMAESSIARFKLSKLLKKMDRALQTMKLDPDQSPENIEKILKRIQRMQDAKVKISNDIGSRILR